MSEFSDLFVPPDGDDAFAKWKASCGPNALAALLERSVHSLRADFDAVNYRGWTNYTQMRGVLARLGVANEKQSEWPEFGLILIQWSGPWEAANVPIAAALKHTHWIATAIGGHLVYEPMTQDWMRRTLWEKVAREWAVEEIKRCTGWRLRNAIAIHP